MAAKGGTEPALLSHPGLQPIRPRHTSTPPPRYRVEPPAAGQRRGRSAGPEPATAAPSRPTNPRPPGGGGIAVTQQKPVESSRPPTAPPGLTRRRALRLAVMAGAGTLAAACGEPEIPKIQPPVLPSTQRTAGRGHPAHRIRRHAPAHRHSHRGRARSQPRRQPPRGRRQPPHLHRPAHLRRWQLGRRTHPAVGRICCTPGNRVPLQVHARTPPLQFRLSLGLRRIVGRRFRQLPHRPRHARTVGPRQPRRRQQAPALGRTPHQRLRFRPRRLLARHPRNRQGRRRPIRPARCRVTLDNRRQPRSGRCGGV